MIVAGRDLDDAGLAHAAIDGERPLDHRPLMLDQLAEKRIDLSRGRREHVEAAGRAEHLAVGVEHRGEAALAGDRIGEPFRPRAERLPRRIAGADDEDRFRPAGKVEPPARRRRRDLPHAEAEANDFEAWMVAGEQLGELGDLCRHRASGREAAREEATHLRLAEEGDPGRVCPQHRAAVAAKDHRGTRVEQHRADSRQSDNVEKGVRLAVHSAPAGPRVPCDRRLRLKQLLIQWIKLSVHALRTTAPVSLGLWLTGGDLVQRSTGPMLDSTERR